MIPLNHTRVAPADAIRAASAFADRMSARRSVREFSPAPIPHGVIEAVIRAAASAPSGANVQPWRFVVVTSPSALAPIGTDWSNRSSRSPPR